jgi:hypothetical protein
MTRFSQWWKRAERAGHASAEAAWMHGEAKERFGVRATISTWAWGLGIPVAAIAATLAFGPWGLLPLALYPIQLLRTASHYRRRGMRAADAWLYGANCVGAKFPNLRGQMTFLWKRLRRQHSTLIEYK